MVQPVPDASRPGILRPVPNPSCIGPKQEYPLIPATGEMTGIVQKQSGSGSRQGIKEE